MTRDRYRAAVLNTSPDAGTFGNDSLHSTGRRLRNRCIPTSRVRRIHSKLNVSTYSDFLIEKEEKLIDLYWYW